MKKYLIIIIALAVLAPATVYAFSFVDVINFSKIFVHKEVQPSAEEVKKEMTAAPENFFSSTAEKKYQNWVNAFNQKDITLALKDSSNLYFTDAEINYLVAKDLATMSNPPARDMQIAFTDNLIKFSGYSMLKFFSGQFILEAKVVEANNRLGLQVTKARYRNFYFPAFLAQSLLADQLKEMINFLYSSPDYQNLSVTVGDGFIELNYAK